MGKIEKLGEKQYPLPEIIQRLMIFFLTTSLRKRGNYSALAELNVYLPDKYPFS